MYLCKQNMFKKSQIDNYLNSTSMRQLRGQSSSWLFEENYFRIEDNY